MVGAVEIDASTAVDLGPAIEGKMVCIFADQHMRDGRPGRHAARDKPRRCRRLDHAVGAGQAGIFRAACDDDTELDRHDVQPFRDVFPDAMQAATVSADQALRFDHLFDAQQLLQQLSAIGGTRLGRTLGSAIFSILLGTDCRDGGSPMDSEPFPRRASDRSVGQINAVASKMFG